MAEYRLPWRADCPRCSEHWTEQNKECRNCTSKTILAAYPFKHLGRWTISFGCGKCNAMDVHLQCDKCNTSMKGVAQVKSGLFGGYKGP